MAKKVLITATVQSHIAQFHKLLINLLKENGYEVHIAAKNNLSEKNGLKIKNVDVIYDIPFSRSPKSMDNIRAYKQLKKIINKNQYEIVHCNTPMGGIVTRLAAKNEKKHNTKILYTAHGFHFYKGAPWINWLFYYPIEWICSFITDTLITINKEDFELAKKHMHSKQIEYIHGVGADENRYNLQALTQDIRKVLGINGEDFLAVCSGELNDNKNQQQLIKAVAELKNPNIKIVLAGNGPKKQYLTNLIDELGIQDNIKLVGYRTDLENIIKASDVVVSTSIREGLPMNIIEGMMCGKPIIATDNRGHRDLIDPDQGGFIVDIDDINAVAEKLGILYANKRRCREMGEHNIKASLPFSGENVKKELERIYGVN